MPEVPAQSDFERSTVSVEGTEPVRAYIKPSGQHPGVALAVIPQADLVQLIEQFDGLILSLTHAHALISSEDGAFKLKAPVIFLPGVGLKCFDLRQSGWEFYREPVLEATAAA